MDELDDENKLFNSELYAGNLPKQDPAYAYRRDRFGASGDFGGDDYAQNDMPPPPADEPSLPPAPSSPLPGAKAPIGMGNAEVDSREKFIRGLKDRLLTTSDRNSEGESDRALSNALMKSAAQIGSFQGNVADTSYLDQFKKDLDASNKGRFDAQQKGIEGEEKSLNEFKLLREKQNELAQRRADTQALMADRSTTHKDELNRKNTENQNKAYTDLRHDLESFRGNFQARQASMDVYSASKALELVANKDPNDLTKQDLELFSAEIAKIAHGGIPSEHGVQALMPSNLQTKVAEITNFLSSNPTPAEAGEYVQHNMGYLSDMVQGAKKVVKDYRTNIAEGYRNRVSPEDFQRATGDYGLGKSAPAPEQPAPTPHGSSGGFGDEAIGSPAGKQVVKKQHNDQTKQTKYFYNDGSSKVVEGLE